MTANLTMRDNGKAEMAYIEGVKPWHGLGTELTPDASLDTWVTAAGMDWQINPAVVRYIAQPDAVPTRYLSFPEKVVLFRSDNKRPLSVVSTDYKVVQPREVLAYFDDLSQRVGFKLKTAGTLFGGRKFWALASMGEDVQLRDPADKLRRQLLLATSADGSMSTVAKFVATCVVCENTITIALGEKGATTIKVSHKRQFDAEEVNAALGIQFNEEFESTMKLFRRLAETPMPVADMIKATVRIHRPDYLSYDKKELTKAVKSKQISRIGLLAVDNKAIGAELEGRHETAWAWLNAVTQYVDHDNGARTGDRRLQKAWFGRGDRNKSNAMALALDYADGTQRLNDPLPLDDGELADVLRQAEREPAEDVETAAAG